MAELAQEGRLLPSGHCTSASAAAAADSDCQCHVSSRSHSDRSSLKDASASSLALCREKVQQRVRERMDEQLRLMQEAFPAHQSLDLSLESLAGAELALSALDADASDDEDDSQGFGSTPFTGQFSCTYLPSKMKTILWQSQVTCTC